MSQLTASRSAQMLAATDGSPLAVRLQQASDRAGYLSQVSRNLSGAMHPARAVDLVLEMLAGPVVEWAQVTLVDRRTYLLRSRHVDGGTEVAQLPVPDLDPGSSLGRVLASGTSDLLMVPDGGDVDSVALASAVPCAELRAPLTSLSPMDLLTIALTARGTTYGALTVARPGGQGFDAAAIAFLEDFAHRVSVTLDTARALADSRRIATVLAQDLRPPTLPTYAGVEFASYHQVAIESDTLGGDFFDVHGGAEDWTAVMGDVCGKGVEAAVLTGKVRQAIRTAALVDRDPAAVLGLVNRVLLSESDDVLVTTVCARGRRVGESLHLDVATAGHPAPLLIRADGSVEEVPVSGTVLGLVPDLTYAAMRLELTRGETCLFFTDGVVEAPGLTSRFDDDRLREVLLSTGACDARTQVESVAVAVTRHLGDRPHDDIAILAMQSTGASHVPDAGA